MNSYQSIVNEYRNIRDNVRVEYINSQRDSQIYQQYMAQHHQPQINMNYYGNGINSILSSFLGINPSTSFTHSPNISVTYGTIPSIQSSFVPLNFFDAITQMINQTQNQDDVKLVLKKHELDKLPKLTPDELKQQIPSLADDDVCPLCLDGYFTDKPIVCSILPCGHHFCYPCIYKELSEYRHVCPLCKNNVGEYEAKI